MTQQPAAAADARPRYALADIEIAACRYFGLESRNPLRWRTRIPKIYRPKTIIIHLARQHTSLSLPQLGKHYRRHHTSILHAVEKAAALVAADPDFAADVEAVRQLVADGPQEAERVRAAVARGLRYHAGKPLPWPPAEEFTEQLSLFEGV